MKEGMRRLVSLQMKVRQQNVVIYGRERARGVIKREREQVRKEGGNIMENELCSIKCYYFFYPKIIFNFLKRKLIQK